MKKILLATTLLAASASFAAADVTVSGSGRMGLVQSRIHAVLGDVGKVKTQFSTRLRIVFSASGTTDGGLSFGGSVRNDQIGNAKSAAIGAATGTGVGDATVFISGAFGKLTFGDVAGGAGDELVGQISGVGFTGLGDTNEIGFLGNTATAVRYDYTSGALSFALGASQTTAADGADNASVAVKYDGGMYNAAVSYETVKGDHLLSAKVGATFGAATVQVKYAKAKATKAEAGISLDYAVSPALTVTAFYTDHAASKTKAKGIGASYDLGGGAKVVGGVIDNGTDTLADIGVTMSF